MFLSPSACDVQVFKKGKRKLFDEAATRLNAYVMPRARATINREERSGPQVTGVMVENVSA